MGLLEFENGPLSGAADAGIVALSLALAPAVRGQGRYWEIPLSAYPAMLQAGVILNRARRSPAAQAFRAYLTGPRARAIFERYGFSMPGVGQTPPSARNPLAPS